MTACASEYINAFCYRQATAEVSIGYATVTRAQKVLSPQPLTRERMTLFVNSVETISAVGVSSQMQEKAKRSSPPRKEHRLELSNPGTMSMLE